MLESIAVYKSHKTSSAELIARLRESFPEYRIIEVTPDDIKKKNLLCGDIIAFFLPGIIDEDSPYLDELGAEGNAKIKSYVEDGGVYVGVCAGAYYACTNIVYDPPWREKPKTSRPGLNFFNALARGPVPRYGIHDAIPSWFSDCTVTPVLYRDNKGQQRKITLAYGNGPALYPESAEEFNLDIIARYADTEGYPIAAASKKTGRGLAIFTGVLQHLRYEKIGSGQNLDRLRILMSQLEPHESDRLDFWNNLVFKIKRHRENILSSGYMPSNLPRNNM